MERYVADYGVLQSLVADNRGEFVSKRFPDFCQRHHTTIHYTTPYNSRENSKTEWVHRSLETVFSILCAGCPLKWPQSLPSCQAVLNSAVHTFTGVEPYFAFFWQHVPRKASAPLPSVPGDAEGLQVVHEVIQATHKTPGGIGKWPTGAEESVGASWLPGMGKEGSAWPKSVPETATQVGLTV